MVSFFKGKTQLGTGTLTGGTATFITSTLKTGTTTVTVLYSGDLRLSAGANIVKQVVKKVKD